MEIKKYAIGRLTAPSEILHNQASNELGIVVAIDKQCDRISFLSETGEKRIFRLSAATLKATKGLSPEVRKAFMKAAKNLVKATDIQREIDRLTQIKSQLVRDNDNFKKELAQARGLLTDSEFTEAVIAALPYDLQRAISRNDYFSEIAHDRRTFVLSRTHYIEKYFRSASFLYEEYDGTMEFAERDENKDYARIKKANAAPLNVAAKLMDYLDLGDKDWLYYTGHYAFPISEGLEFTETNAKKLAQRIAGLSK